MPGEKSERLRPAEGAGRLREFVSRRVDVEMFRKGWWMLLLIIGSIGVLFTIGVVLMSKQ
ncbi:MAG: hypothetical protein ACLQDL_08970 [Spirochaetia bacterium]